MTRAVARRLERGAGTLNAVPPGFCDRSHHSQVKVSGPSDRRPPVEGRPRPAARRRGPGALLRLAMAGALPGMRTATASRVRLPVQLFHLGSSVHAVQSDACT